MAKCHFDVLFSLGDKEIPKLDALVKTLKQKGQADLNMGYAKLLCCWQHGVILNLSADQ